MEPEPPLAYSNIELPVSHNVKPAPLHLTARYPKKKIAVDDRSCQGLTPVKTIFESFLHLAFCSPLFFRDYKQALCFQHHGIAYLPLLQGD